LPVHFPQVGAPRSELWNLIRGLVSDGATVLLTGGPVARPVVQSLLWAAAIAAVFAPLSVWALNR